MTRLILLLLCWIVPAPLLAQATLHEAALTGKADAIVTLIDGGADPDGHDAYGSTPLSVAVIFDQAASVQALLDHGADADAMDAQGSAPLHLAAFFGREEAAQMLVQAGADQSLTNASGDRPLDIALRDFAIDRPVYTTLAGALAPLGFMPNEAAVIAARPRIVALLRGTDTPPRITQHQAIQTMFAEAEEVETLRALLVTQNGQTLREGYFNGHTATTPNLIQSVNKSVVSAMIGIGLEQGCIRDLDLTAAELFPEADLTDEKGAITLRQFLQMRSGLPWEETDPALWAELMEGQSLRAFAIFPLTGPAGTRFNYSNLTANLLTQVYERRCDADIRDMAIETLFGPIGAADGVGEWWAGEDGYHYPILHLTAHTSAALGQLFLNGGSWNGQRVLPAEWVTASLTPYTAEAWRDQTGDVTLGSHFHKVGYGYQWWTAEVGAHPISFAWGHGGQLIVLVPDLQMVITTQSDPFWGEHSARSWRHEQEVINLVGRFLSSF